MRAVVILAAGKGTRMRSDRPKVLHPLLGQPLLEYPLNLAGELEAERSVVVVGHGREEVQCAFEGRRVTWAVQEPQHGTGHAASVGIEALLESGGAANAGAADVVILNGDLPLLRLETLRRLVTRHEERGAAVTLLTCRKSDPSGFGRILREGEAGEFTAIVEEADADAPARAIREVNVGTYVFRASAFLDCYPKTGRENRQGEYYLPDVAVQAAREGRVVETVEVEDERETLQVNSRSELARCSEVLRERLLEEYMDSGVTIDDPRTTYIETGVRIGRDTRIHPFTVIRRGVEVGRGCEIGPFVQLRPGTELDGDVHIGNFVEVKNSRLGSGTKASHLSYIGDAEVGRGVNVGAGTVFANYDGKKKNRTIIEDRVFIGSGTVLVAPLRVGEGAITGAGSVVLKNRDVGAGTVVAGVPARPIERKSDKDET